MVGPRHTAAIVTSYLSAVDDGGSYSDERLSSSCSDADNEFKEENEEEHEDEDLDDPGNSSTSIDHVSSGAVINFITSVSQFMYFSCKKELKVRRLAPFWVKTNRREDCGSGQACLQRMFCGGTCEAR